MPEIPQEAGAGVTFLRAIAGDRSPVNHIAWSPSGDFLTCSRQDGVVRIVNAMSGDSKEFKGHSANAYRAAWSPDGSLIASGSADCNIRMWDPSTLEEQCAYAPPQLAPVAAATRPSDFTTEWALPSTTHYGKPVAPIVFCVAWSFDGRFLAASCNNGRAFVLDRDCHVKHVFDLHSGPIYGVAWSPEGRFLATASGDKTIRLWKVVTGERGAELKGHTDNVLAIAWSPDGNLVASGSDDNTVRVWRVATGQQICVLEGHTAAVVAVDFSFDGRVLASKSRDGTIALWAVDKWSRAAVIKAPTTPTTLLLGGLAFHPHQHTLASLGSDDMSLLIWDIDIDKLLAEGGISDSVRYTTAKLVLVGDTGVGKTGLGWRLSHNDFRDHSSTHGQQFWTVDALSVVRPDNVACEAVLWDFAGQPDYRIVHSLLLDDIDLALVVFDPSYRERPLAGVEFWLAQLRYVNKYPVATVLVGARIDRGSPTLTTSELEEFCAARGIVGGYVATSAAKGDGIATLIARAKDIIPWNTLPPVVTTKTFKSIKDFILSMKEGLQRQHTFVNSEQLRKLLKEKDPMWEFSDQDMLTAVRHLANHGYVTLLRDAHNDELILLRPELLSHLASSFVLEARRNPRGLGVIEEDMITQGDIMFAEVAELLESEKAILLDAVTRLFLSHNLCFRETFGERAFLVFPSLINEKRPRIDERQTRDDVTYNITGAIENVYAALVVLLGYTNTFTRTHQWQNHAQYELAEGEVCGFKQYAEREGEIELTLYYGMHTSTQTTHIFQGLFERFLRQRKVSVVRIPTAICGHCGKSQERAVVAPLIERGESTFYCYQCGKPVVVPIEDKLFSDEGVAVLVVDEQDAAAVRRTAFETDLVRLKRIISELQRKAPKCFISYAWGVKAIERRVMTLAVDLRNAGVDVVLDKWHCRLGTGIDRYVDRIAECDHILVIGTPLLVKKYQTFNTQSDRGSETVSDPVVSAELGVITTIVMRPNQYGVRVIPLLFEGERDQSLTIQLSRLSYLDFRASDQYFDKLIELLLCLFDIPDEHPSVGELRSTAG